MIRTEAERLIDLGRMLRSSRQPLFFTRIEQTIGIDAQVLDEFKLALDFTQFCDRHPGQAFNAIVEEWPLQRIHLELY